MFATHRYPHSSGPRRTTLATALTIAVLALLPTMALAQTTASGSSQDATEAKDLDKVQVTGKKPDSIGIMPGQPESGVYGIDKSLAETPRSLTSVSSDLVENYGMEDINDLVRMTPGAYTGSFFGIAGSLSLRGESADNYFRGMKRVQNSGNYATPIRAARSLEIVRGPASPVYGAGQIGGYMNFIPKSASSDSSKYITEATGEAGLIVGSYDKYIGWVEGGMPFTLAGQQGGVYAYLQHEDSKSYYDNVEPESTLVQVAVDMDLGEHWSTEFGIQYLHDSRIQNPGWNRVTQDLVDNGTYITGQTTSLNTRGNVLYPDNVRTDIASGVGFPGGSGNALLDVFCSGYDNCSLPDGLTNGTLQNPGTTKLKRSQVFTDPSDVGRTYLTTLYFDVMRYFDNGAQLKNQMFYETMSHYKYTSYGFTAGFDGTVFEDKVSLNLPFTFGDIVTNTTVGVDYRHSSSYDREAYGDEIFDRRDISVGSTSNDRFDNGHTGANETAPGQYWRTWSSLNYSIYDDYSAFALSDITWNKWNLLLGYRYDYYQIDAVERAQATNGDLVGNDANGDGRPDWSSDSQGASSYNASLSYKFETGIIPYVTYAKSEALDTNSIGGVAVEDVDGGNWLQDSKLKEAGIKYQSHDGNVYAAIDYFDQDRFYRDTVSGTDILVQSKGWEGELRWLISQNFSLSSALTKLNVTERGAPFTILNTATVAAAYGLDPSQLYGYRLYDPSGSVLGGQWQRGGVPEWVGSLYGNFTHELGNGRFHASLGVTSVEGHYADDQALIRLPGYELWNGSVGYATGPWSFLFNIDNLTDEKYFTSADLFDSVLVLPSEPRQYTATISYKF